MMINGLDLHLLIDSRKWIEPNCTICTVMTKHMIKTA